MIHSASCVAPAQKAVGGFHAAAGEQRLQPEAERSVSGRLF